MRHATKAEANAAAAEELNGPTAPTKVYVFASVAFGGRNQMRVAGRFTDV